MTVSGHNDVLSSEDEVNVQWLLIDFSKFFRFFAK